MTTTEFKDELNVIYENINKGGAPGLDDYEISVILSNAQEELVKAMPDESFPGLVAVDAIASPTTTGIDDGYSFNLPSDWLRFLNEKVENVSGDVLRVLPISPEEYTSKLSKAYSYPPRRRAWRLLLDESDTNSAVEIRVRSGFVPTTYTLRYLRRPTPIIVADLSTLTPATTIDGLSAITQCEIADKYHRDIIKYASQLADQYYMDKYETTNGDQ